MALVLIEGFDHYAAGAATAKGWSNNPTSMAAGRFGGQAAQQNSNANMDKTLPTTYTTLIVGIAFKPASVTTANYAFIDIKTAASANIAILRLNTSGKLEVTNNAGTIIATGTTVFTIGNWYYVEYKVFVNTGTPASGTVEVHLNGATEIASTAGNFGSTAMAKISCNAQNANSTLDDLYVADTTGSAPNNTFLGDVRVATQMPDGDGFHLAWTPTGGGAHYTQVNETLADGDTSYVSDSTPGDIDTYTVADIDASATVFAVQKFAQTRKDDAALRQVAFVLRASGVDHVGATTFTEGTTYSFVTEIENADTGGSAWTAANLNAVELGVKEIA